MIALDEFSNVWCDYCGTRSRIHKLGYQSAQAPQRAMDPMHYVYCPGCHTETRRGVVCTAEQALDEHRKLCAARKAADEGKVR